MKFLIVTFAPTLKNKDTFSSYAPYVYEINLWTKHIEEFGIISPTKYEHELLKANFNVIPKIFSVPLFSFTSIKSSIQAIFLIPLVIIRLFKAMNWADHIHLRCPSNIALLGCFVQIFFPKKIKTAKYAGNWDPDSKQPFSYKLQQRILSNTFFTKNMQVLVYGKWKNQTKNIKSFFTASFNENEIEKVIARDYNDNLSFMFVGSLVEGKRPLLAIKIVESLINEDKKAKLDIYGDGILKNDLQLYVKENGLDDIIVFHGNQPKNVVKQSLKKVHFLILPSKSEGWPKVIAEAMFFGVIPIATKISCVPYMLDYGSRGILIEADLEQAVIDINEYLSKEDLVEMSKKASKWSQEYTLDKFESEIVKLLNQ